MHTNYKENLNNIQTHLQLEESTTTFITTQADLQGRTGKQDRLYHVLRQLQAVLRRRELADPDLSQSKIFAFCTPLFIFIGFLIVGVIIPRKSGLQAHILTTMEDFSNHKMDLCMALLWLMGGFGSGLVVLRGIIWGGAEIVHWFCELNLRELDRLETYPGETELSQANLIMGGFL